jgi:hypothetical protein
MTAVGSYAWSDASSGRGTDPVTWDACGPQSPRLDSREEVK